MRRDTQAGKPRYDLIDRAFLRRWAELMGRGAEKYGERNWELANSQEEVDRFKASAFRHLMQWLDGDEAEDHAAAVAFNLAAAERTKGKTQEALDAGYEVLAADRAWPKVYADSKEPNHLGTYVDTDGDTWRFDEGVWQYFYGGRWEPSLAGCNWQGVVGCNRRTFPWERIS